MKIENSQGYFDKISDYVHHYGATTPERQALVCGDTRLNYREFASGVKQLSKALMAHGVTTGSRVALLGPPTPEFFTVMMATVDIGAIWMGLHPRYKLPEFRHVINTAEPIVVFAFSRIDGRDYESELTTLQQDYPCIRTLVVFDREHSALGVYYNDFLKTGDDTSDDQWQHARRQVKPDDTAVIIFTSGTTGRPKGAMNSHFGLIHCAHIELDRWPGDNIRLLQNMPINHIANIGMMSSYALVAGGTLVFMPRFDAANVLEVIEKERITFWLQAPAMYHLVINHPSFPETDLSSLQYIIWGGGPMPQHMVEFLHQLGATLAMAYGMTELTAYASYSDLDASPEVLANTIGKPEPRYELRLMKSNGGLAEVNEPGEIQAGGRWLMNGYFNQPEATADAFTADGWFKTGDVAQAREDGNWVLVGRTKEMYKSGGFNIYPREIEIAIEAHPAVAMTAVLGVSDPLYNEVGHAFVELQPGGSVTTDELNQWCHQRLANYKVPKAFEIIDELPKLPIGKIDKQQLKKTLQPRNS